MSSQVCLYGPVFARRLHLRQSTASPKIITVDQVFRLLFLRSAFHIKANKSTSVRVFHICVYMHTQGGEGSKASGDRPSYTYRKTSTVQKSKADCPGLNLYLFFKCLIPEKVIKEQIVFLDLNGHVPSFQRSLTSKFKGEGNDIIFNR